jgi:hypothetical protein
VRRLRRALGLVALAAAGACWFAVPSASPAAAEASPVVFADPSPQVVEGSTTVRIVVNRVDLPVSRLVVQYGTERGTAEPDVDFVETRGSLVFEVGARSATFVVEVRDDDVVESTEHLVLRVVAQQTSTTAQLSILDDDRPAASPAGTSSSFSSSSSSGSSSSAGGGVIARSASPGGVAPASPAQVQVRRRVVVATPSRRKVLVRQNPVTPFELRPAAPSHDDLPPVEPTVVDPVLALAAGLLFARVAAEVWFRVREAAAA